MNSFRRLFLVIVFPLLLAVAVPATFTGCANPEATAWEKSVVTHKDVWTVTKAAYDSWCERVVKPGSKVTPEQEATADVAWNSFRAAYRQSLVALKNNETAPAPADLQKLSSGLLTLLKP